MATAIEYSGPEVLMLPLNPGESLGKVFDVVPEIGCQFVPIHMPPESGRKPLDQVLIVMEPGGRSPFVTLTADKEISAWAVQGMGWAIIRRADGSLESYLIGDGQKEKILQFNKGDTLGFANAGEDHFVVRDHFDPHFEETDEARPRRAVLADLITKMALAYEISNLYA
jgi:hypothetical protein